VTIACYIDTGNSEPHRTYEFAALPRIGESLVLEWSEADSGYPIYTVTDIHHMPDDVQNRPSFIVLFVKKLEKTVARRY